MYLRRALLSTDCSAATVQPRRVLDDGDRSRWTSVTRPRRPSSARGCGPGSATTTRGLPRRRPTTTTGRGRPSGTRRSTTPGSSACRWPTEYRRPRPADRLRRHPRRGARARAGAPPRPSLGYLVQGILKHGSDDIQAPLPARASINGRDRWCQGFSEPDAGSDLASLRTTRRPRRRRVRDQRPQDLDELLRRRRLVPPPRPHRPRRAQAQGPLRVRRADATSPASSSGRCG